MAHVLSAHRGPATPAPRRLWPWSWRLIVAIDAASGIGMLLIGVAVSGLAGVIAVVLGVLVLVESAYLISRSRSPLRRHAQAVVHRGHAG